MKYLIYKIINLINDKIYIGCHSTDDENDGYMGSGLLIRKAIKKYGITNFRKEILYRFDNYHAMIEMECELVNEEFVRRDDTYNISIGGAYDYRNERSKPEISKKLCGRKFSRKTIERMCGKVPVIDRDGHRFKVSVDDERYLNGDLVHTSVGRNQSDETKEKIRIRTIGRKVTDETKEKIRNSMIGEKNHFYGKRHTEDSRKKISKQLKGKKREFSDEHRKNLSLAMMGNTNGKKK